MKIQLSYKLICYSFFCFFKIQFVWEPKFWIENWEKLEIGKCITSEDLYIRKRKKEFRDKSTKYSIKIHEISTTYQQYIHEISATKVHKISANFYRCYQNIRRIIYPQYIAKFSEKKKLPYNISIGNEILAIYRRIIGKTSWFFFSLINGNLKSGLHLIVFGITYLCSVLILTSKTHIQICNQQMQIDWRAEGD